MKKLREQMEKILDYGIVRLNRANTKIGVKP